MDLYTHLLHMRCAMLGFVVYMCRRVVVVIFRVVARTRLRTDDSYARTTTHTHNPRKMKIVLVHKKVAATARPLLLESRECIGDQQKGV